ncbi:MAG: DUF1844 domain-containing protein [Deltaproteobacteria bacterium]|nr:DUF1844 domain-containing protein [Deltaproteobacteria bacterium]
MAEEEKGFVIKDKRSLDEKGDLKAEIPKDEKIKEEQKKEQKQKETKTPPLPEVNFTSLIFSLSSSALFHFGEIEDPQTGQKKKDLPIAKHAIDTIAMLMEKTKGNLAEEEQKFVNSILADLRWRYVKATE